VITARFRDERGFGLTELIVAMFIFGIIGTLMITLVVTISRSFTQERAATDSTMVAAVGMNELTRVMRSGTEVPVAGGTQVPVFVEAFADKVTLYAYIDTTSLSPRPTKIQFAVDPVSRDLTETRWAGVPVSGEPGAFSFSPTPESVRTIARKIIDATDGTPLFTYLAVVTDPADPDFGTAQPLDATGGVNSSLIPTISVVQIAMNVQADITARAEPIMLKNRVGIPNLGISRIGL